MITDFKIRITAVAAATLLAPAAFAGGYTAPVDPVPPIVMPDTQVAAPWAGAYVGLGLGYAFGGDDVVGVSSPADVLLGSPGELNLSGLTYGVHVGYRWQTEMSGRQIVIGPELSYESGSADASFDSTTPAATGSAEMNNFMALRLKTGVLSADGASMFYGIAGYGRGDFDYEVSGLGMSYSDSYNDNAWILGLGAERKISARTSIFGEWEFRGFGKTTLTDAAGFMTEATPEQHHVKVGVNFSF